MADLYSNLFLNDLKNLKKLVLEYQSEFLHFFKLDKNIIPCNNNSLNETTYPIIFNDLLNTYSIPDYSFKIGNVAVKNPVVCAPLAGISDNTYRIFAKAFGSSLSFTEMISSYGVYFNSKDSILLSNITEFERPCGIQIFGSEPQIIAEAAQRLEDKAELIDINMGCPVPKVLRSKSGGFLLQDERRIKNIISAVIFRIKKPLTIKARIGWDKNDINIERIAKLAESCGVSAITIHGRTVRQGFSGDVNYNVIKDVKRKVKIPVIVSGDINSPSKAKKVLDFTGCDAVMIGRAVRGSLWILFNILTAFYDKDYLLKLNINYSDDIYINTFNSNDNINDNISNSKNIKNSNAVKKGIYKRDSNILNSDLNRYDVLNKSNYFNYIPELDWRKKFAELYLKFMIYFKGEDKAIKEFRKHLSWVFKGLAGVGKKRRVFYLIDTYNQAIKTINKL